MKNAILICCCIIICSTSFAQKTQQEKIDSVCELVKKYWAEKNPDKIYDMAGELFRQQLSAENFKTICNHTPFYATYIGLVVTVLASKSPRIAKTFF